MLKTEVKLFIEIYTIDILTTEYPFNQATSTTLKNLKYAILCLDSILCRFV